jgi:protein-disulfide isomerase
MKNEIVRLATPVDEGADHILGPSTAAATLVEYGDYECPYCRQIHPMVNEIMRRTEGLRFIYRHFPITKIHPHSKRAAEAAEAAGTQGRFWEMHDQLYAHDRTLDDEYLTSRAKKIGLDMESYSKEMADGVYAQRVDEAFRSALYSNNVTGTPTLYLNGVRISSINNLEELLAEVLEAGATLLHDVPEQNSWRSRLRKLRVGMTRLRN